MKKIKDFKVKKKVKIIQSSVIQTQTYLRYGYIYLQLLYLCCLNIIVWRGKWQPTPVFLPGESQGRRSLIGCRL